MLFAFTIASFIATLLGGLFAMRLRDRLHLVLGFSAGAVVGVALFDLMPEAVATGAPAHGVQAIFGMIAVGFALYMLIDRFVALHSHTDHEGHVHHRNGVLGAGTLSLHSFLDGLGIGLAFQVSPSLGLVVALAVIAHDFSDGINTVNMILRAGSDRARAMRWLLVDAAAPVLGILASLFVSVSEPTLGILLALFAGFFLYVGASDLLPESHHEHPVFWTTAATILGLALMYAVVSAAGL